MIDKKTRKVYSEMDAFLNAIGSRYSEKVPKEIRELFRTEKDREYSASIDVEKLINEEKLMNETYDMIAYLNLKYWCEDVEEKREYRDAYIRNEIEYQKKHMKI